ncbi:MAG: glycosyltransferase family 39 protein [Vicinamibacteria bacterium]
MIESSGESNWPAVAPESAIPSPSSFMAILLTALMMRAFCFLVAVGHPERFLTIDSHQYVALVGHLRSAYFDPSSPDFAMGLFRTPGYPAFLAFLLNAFDGSLQMVIGLQIAIAVFGVGLAVLLASRLLGPRVGAMAGLMLALDPASILYACFVQPDTLFTALTVAGVLIWVRSVEGASLWAAVISGFVLGLAALTRPIGIFLPLMLPLTLMARSGATRRLGLAGCFLAGAFLPIGGWMAKNQVLTGSPVFTILGDSALLHYRAAGALAEDEGIPIEEARDRVWKRFWSNNRPGASAVELSVAQRRLAFVILSEHKGAAVRMMGRSAMRMAFGTGLTALSRLQGAKDPEAMDSPAKRVLTGLQLLIALIASAAIARGSILLIGQRRFFEVSLLLGTAAYFLVVSAGPEANTRFRLPATPFLAILASHGLSRREVRDSAVHG